MSQVREDPATPALKLRSLGGPYLILPKRSNRGEEGQSAAENISHSALQIQRDYSTAILAPGSAFLERCSMRSSIISRIALRNSIREFARCCRASGETPSRERT